MNEFEETLQYFISNSLRNSYVKNWEDSKDFFVNSSNKEWIYLIKFNSGITPIYAWGTAKDKGQRLRKSSIFDSKLTGKYDRRVDYLMLKILYGQPEVYLFEMNNNSFEIEQMRRQYFYGATATGACIRGTRNVTRMEIALEIFALFKNTHHYIETLNNSEKRVFEDFVTNYWLAHLRHPTNPRRTFYFGDCLEPNFLDRTLGRNDLIPVIEKTLKVNF